MNEIFIKVYQLVKAIEYRILKDMTILNFRNSTTFLGDSQHIVPGAKAMLLYGSKKEDIILKEHCEVCGTLVSENGGKIIINEWAKVGAHCEINSVKKVEIGRDVSMAKGVIIVDNNSHPICPADRQYMAHTPHGSLERSSQYGTNAPVHIGNNVWIGSYSRICKGVTIGDNSIIGANSVVTHDVPANCIAVGNPARVVKEHIDEITSPIFPIKK